MPEACIASGQDGYGRLDFALDAGAWAVEEAMRSAYLGKIMSPDESPRFDPPEAGAFTEQIKAAAESFGAAEVGVTRVNPLWLYAARGETESPVITESLDVAVVMSVEMDFDLLATSPAVSAAAATAMGYSKMTVAAVSLATYLTSLGYRALPSGNDTALSIPLAIDAGLGEIGRGGQLITRKHGPRVRLCKVFTDAPLLPDEPVSCGFQKTCATCTKCADACPADAIPYGDMTAAGPSPSNNPGALKWYTDPDKCLTFWRENGTCCSNCIAACPYNRKPE